MGVDTSTYLASMDVLFMEMVTYILRIPGALFLIAVTRKNFDHWMERDRAFGVGIMGAVVMGLFISTAILASG